MCVNNVFFQQYIFEMTEEHRHWIIRVNDGINLKNSRYPIWGVKRGRAGCVGTIVSHMKEGDVLWFMTSRVHGGKMIGMAEYVCNYDRAVYDDMTHIVSNHQQNWIGDEDWDIQIHYKNYYDTERQNIKACIRCAATVLKYETFREKIADDLTVHYTNFKTYAEPSW